jgi:dTDP-4-amino-4,6-dideoxygalactose transaminase
LLDFDPRERANYQYVIVEVDASRTALDRDSLVRILHAEGVLARRYFTPGCHRMEPYRSRMRSQDGPLPHTDYAARTTMALPTGTAVTTADVERIGCLLGLVVQHGEEIRRRLSVSRPIHRRIA